MKKFKRGSYKEAKSIQKKKMEEAKKVAAVEEPPEIVWHTHDGLKYAVIRDGMCAVELKPLPPTPKFQNDAITPTITETPLTVNVGMVAVDETRVV